MKPGGRAVAGYHELVIDFNIVLYFRKARSLLIITARNRNPICYSYSIIRPTDRRAGCNQSGAEGTTKLRHIGVLKTHSRPKSHGIRELLIQASPHTEISPLNPNLIRRVNQTAIEKYRWITLTPTMGCQPSPPVKAIVPLSPSPMCCETQLPHQEWVFKEALIVSIPLEPAKSD